MHYYKFGLNQGPYENGDHQYFYRLQQFGELTVEVHLDQVVAIQRLDLGRKLEKAIKKWLQEIIIFYSFDTIHS